MLLSTFNINGINRRLKNLLDWLGREQPDVVCLQELKATNEEFPVKPIRDAGYGAVWRGERSWNGVAILTRGTEPVLIRNQLPGDAKDRQSRYIEAACNGILVGCLYAPNGNPQPGPKFIYKLQWMKRLLEYAKTLHDAKVPVVLAGDYNVVPTDADIYNTRSWLDNALLQPEARAAFQMLSDQGWTDAIRHLHPTQPMYTFWDYMRNRWPRDAGLRIDHFLLSPPLVARLKAAGVHRDVRGEEGASDHAPAWIELSDNEVPTKRANAVNKTKGKKKASRVKAKIDG